MVTDLQAHGVKDMFVASVDGLTRFKEAIQSVFLWTQVQHYVAWKDRNAFVADLKTIYQGPTLEQATANLHRLTEIWAYKYAIAGKLWEKNWEDLATFFNYLAKIRRIIYTTNRFEAYHPHLLKVTKPKSSFPTPEAA
jgi:putative transposase